MGKIAAAKACMYRLTKSNISSRTGRQISIFIYNPARRRRFILTNRIGPGTQAPSHLLQENRKSRYAFFSIIIFAVACPSAFAQTIEQTDLAYVIVAGKNSFEQEYKTGSRFLIKFKCGSSIQKTRGFFAGATEGKIVILPKQSSKEVVIIPPDSILVLKRIRPTQRIINAAAGITLTGTGAALLDKAGNTSGNSGSAVLFIPVIGAGVYFLCAIPVSLVIEKLNEKKKVNGWTFSIKRQ